MKTDYESDDELRGCVRCLSALAHVPVDDVAESFRLLSEQMPEHEKMNELLSYFQHTYIRGRRLRGRGNHYGSATFPIPIWNQYESAGDGIARTTNIVESWHYGIHVQSSFNVVADRRAGERLPETEGSIRARSYWNPGNGVKKYRDLVGRVRRAVAGYGRANVSIYLRAIARLSHS